MRHPRESVGILLATCAVLAVYANALFMQKGPHPAPIFAARPPIVASAITAPQPLTPVTRPAAVTMAPAPAASARAPKRRR